MNLARSRRALDGLTPLRTVGRVVEVQGLAIRVSLPHARVGDLCTISTARGQLPAEVAGFVDGSALLMPLADVRGLGPGAEVSCLCRPMHLMVGDSLRGRVLDGLGLPIDGKPLPTEGLNRWSVDRPCPDPYTRRRIANPLALGVRAIDGLLTVGEGQRIGLFAGSGVGKSTLLGQIARNSTAEIAVICLVGERGREMMEFVEGSLGAKGMVRAVVVCATSEQPPMLRLRAGFVATAIAEYFREQGKSVLFLLDSVTRVARAQREVGLALGEPPARQGYPPSVFAMLPRLLERTGNSARGLCTAIYTCLVAGGDMEEPIADEVRGLLDGHVVLARSLAQRGQWPAIDVVASVSRVMGQVAAPEHLRSAAQVRELLAAYERQRDFIQMGAYEPGSDALTDVAIAKLDDLNGFLRQGADDAASYSDTLARLLALVPA